MSLFQAAVRRLSECGCRGPAHPPRIPVFESRFSAEMLLAGVKEVPHVTGACQGGFIFGLWSCQYVEARCKLGKKIRHSETCMDFSEVHGRVGGRIKYDSSIDEVM